MLKKMNEWENRRWDSLTSYVSIIHFQVKRASWGQLFILHVETIRKCQICPERVILNISTTAFINLIWKIFDILYCINNKVYGSPAEGCIYTALPLELVSKLVQEKNSFILVCKKCFWSDRIKSDSASKKICHEMKAPNLFIIFYKEQN